jgi:hypothetical protein
MTLSARWRSPRRTITRWGALASGGALLYACKGAPSSAPAASDAGPTVVRATGSGDAGFAEARCTFVAGAEGAFTLDDVGDPRALEVGEGVPIADGVAVGIVHAPASGPEAVVAHAARVEGRIAVNDWVVARRGELVPDAPPPKPLVAGGVLYAAYVARIAPLDGGKASRRIVLRKEGVAAPIATYPERADESLAFDASLTLDGSRAAVVWDDDAGGADKPGGITVAVAPLGGGEPLAPRVISGETADPEAPRLAPREGGWWVAWLAHRPESSSDAGAHPGPVVAEAPAEDRVFTWIEVVAIGSDGAPIAPPRRITSPVGRAASFDLAPRAHGGLDVVVRDEIQVREGEGGRILHVAVFSDGRAEDPIVIVPAGVGRGAIDLVGGPGDKAWLAYSDPQDRALLVPLVRDALAGGAVERASVEEVLEGGRILTVASAANVSVTSQAAPSRFTAAFPGAAGALFREVACAP